VQVWYHKSCALIVAHGVVNNLSSRFYLFALHFTNEMVFSFSIPTIQFCHIIKCIDAPN
jgi:hypothetical protein